MNDFKTLTGYAEEIMSLKNQPHALADLQIEISAKYAFMSDIAKDLQLEKAIFWQIKYAGEKPLSDKGVEAKWLETEGGKKEIRMKFEMKGLEKLLSACKSSIVVNSIEAKLNY